MSGRLSFENLNRKPIGSKRAGMMASQHHFLGSGRHDPMKLNGGASVMNKVQQLISPRRVPMKDQTNLSFYMEHGADAQRETMRADDTMKRVVATEVLRAQEAYKKGLRGPALSGFIGKDLYGLGKTLSAGNQMYPSDSWNVSSLNNPAFREQVDPQVTNDAGAVDGVANPSEGGDAGTDWGRYLRGALAIAGTAAAAYGLARGVNAYMDGIEPAAVAQAGVRAQDLYAMGRRRMADDVLQQNLDAAIQNDPIQHAAGGRRVASGSAQTVTTAAPQAGVAAASLFAATQNLESTQLARGIALTDAGGNQPTLIGTPQAQAATDMRSVMNMAESQRLPEPARVIPNPTTPGNQVAGGQGDANPISTGSLNGVRSRPTSAAPSVSQDAKRPRVYSPEWHLSTAQRQIQFATAINMDGTVRRQEGDISGVPQTELLPQSAAPMRRMTRAAAAADPQQALEEAAAVAQARGRKLAINMKGGSPTQVAKDEMARLRALNEEAMSAEEFLDKYAKLFR